jgi:hypothetical protein
MLGGKPPVAGKPVAGKPVAIKPADDADRRDRPLGPTANGLYALMPDSVWTSRVAMGFMGDGKPAEEMTENDRAVWPYGPDGGSPGPVVAACTS